MSTTGTQLPPTSQVQVEVRKEPHSSRTPSLVLLGFAAVYIIWGSTYFAIRVGVESVPPLLLAGMRHLGFGLLFYPIFRMKSPVKPSWEHWINAAITGF